MPESLQSQHPPDEELESFLKDAAGNWLPEQIIQHLDQCQSCQSRLESLASDENGWNDAAEALSSDDLPSDPWQVGVTMEGDTSSAEDSVRTDRSKQALALLSPYLTPSDDPRMLGRLGRFEILGIVGSGGMGIVLKACDPSLARYVAIKILAPHLASSDTARIRFAREAKAAAAVVHDNVIAIYQVGQFSELPYLVMPYLPGPSLEQRIAADGPLDVEATLSIALQVARGLAAAHQQGLVHRDVKPANVLLATGTERAVITDFGLARASDDASITRVGTLAGTPHYMSPEQARGEVVDSRSDLFSLGSLVFAMLSGGPPIPLETGSETIREIAKGEMPPLRGLAADAPHWLEELVSRLHRAHPDARPSIEETVELIQQCLAAIREPSRHCLPEQLLSASAPQRLRTLHRRWLLIPLLLLIAIPIAALMKNPIGDEPILLLGPIQLPESTTEQTASPPAVEISSAPPDESETGVANEPTLPGDEFTLDLLPKIDRDIRQLSSELDQLEQTLQLPPEASTP